MPSNQSPAPESDVPYQLDQLVPFASGSLANAVFDPSSMMPGETGAAIVDDGQTSTSTLILPGIAWCH
jgi:hypothetical protein